MPVYALPAMLFMVGIPSVFVTFFSYSSGSLVPPAFPEQITKFHRGLQCLCDILWTIHLCLDPFNIMDYFELSSLLGGFALTSCVLSIGAWIVRLAMAICEKKSYGRLSVDGGLEDEEEVDDKWIEGDCRWISLRLPFAAPCAAVCAPRAWVFSSTKTGAQGLLTHTLVASMPGICYALIANDHLYFQSTSVSAQACIGLMTVLIGVPYSISMLCVKPKTVISDTLAAGPRLEFDQHRGFMKGEGDMDDMDEVGGMDEEDLTDGGLSAYHGEGASEHAHGPRDPFGARDTGRRTESVSAEKHPHSSFVKRTTLVDQGRGGLRSAEGSQAGASDIPHGAIFKAARGTARPSGGNGITDMFGSLPSESESGAPSGAGPAGEPFATGSTGIDESGGTPPHMRHGYRGAARSGPRGAHSSPAVGHRGHAPPTSEESSQLSSLDETCGSSAAGAMPHGGRFASR